MKPVLSVTSECVPLVKTGGLADVAGALPDALKPCGWRMRTLLPGYPRVLEAAKRAKELAGFPNLFGGDARVLGGKVSGLDMLILDAPHLYDRNGTPYLDDQGQDYADNPERFAALSWVAAEIAEHGIGGWKPKMVHCHDWQAALTPYYLAKRGSPAPSILTIHNVAFQGIAAADRLHSLRLDPVDFSPEGFEYWGQISTLKAGLVFADRITTVSPRYALELMTPEFGMGMDGILRQRQSVVSGILNGIDEEVWNPASDAEIATFKTARGKSRAKRQIVKELGLTKTDGPLAIVISRLTHQKGLDILLDAIPAFLDGGGQVAVLGAGEKALEAAFARAAEHPNVAVRIGYDEGLSHRMMAGGDAILVPSRFEPCGLTQLYGLRYGTIPVVAMTGGLADTVIHASPMALRSGVATGLQFSPVDAAGLAAALKQLMALYAEPDIWAELQANAMRQRVGWHASALEYAALYDSVSGAS